MITDQDLSSHPWSAMHSGHAVRPVNASACWPRVSKGEMFGRGKWPPWAPGAAAIPPGPRWRQRIFSLLA
eukprot:SAG22_NODE_14639_length_369_cov_0.770370_1_plen_69_part_01